MVPPPDQNSARPLPPKSVRGALGAAGTFTPFGAGVSSGRFCAVIVAEGCGRFSTATGRLRASSFIWAAPERMRETNVNRMCGLLPRPQLTMPTEASSPQCRLVNWTAASETGGRFACKALI
jgi:hypothetical protein